jgi:hypothetical protein
MSEITTAKDQFAAALTAAGLKVLAYVPERIVPPIVIVNVSSPYLTAANFGEYNVNLELVLVAATATNKTATEALDQHIEDVLNALPGFAQFSTVNQPYNLQVNNAEYLAANVYVTLQITI